VKFLVDRCAGRRLAEWLQRQGHDVAYLRGPDPGDPALLAQAAKQGRVLVTLDQDFGKLVFVAGEKHAGLVRLPDVTPDKLIALMEEVLAHQRPELEAASILTVELGRIRIRKTGPSGNGGKGGAGRGTDRGRRRRK
jgi:predicted nuclease of predicted toxin-antitoxin system